MFRKKIVSVYTLLGRFVFSTHLRATDFLVEARAAYFLPTDHKFRKIYSGGGGMYGGEFTCQLHQKLCGWISADYFSKNGSSIGEHDPTKITIVPFGAGLKYLFPLKGRENLYSANLYIGAGVLGTYVHMKDHSPYVVQSSSKLGVGGIAKGGAICRLGEYFFADLFSSYTYTKIGFQDADHGKVTQQNANLSGWALVIYLGVRTRQVGLATKVSWILRAFSLVAYCNTNRSTNQPKGVHYLNCSVLDKK